MAEANTLTVSAQVRGLWQARLAVVPLMLARWLLGRVGVVVEIRSGRYLISRELVKPQLEVKVKT